MDQPGLLHTFQKAVVQIIEGSIIDWETLLGQRGHHFHPDSKYQHHKRRNCIFIFRNANLGCKMRLVHCYVRLHLVPHADHIGRFNDTFIAVKLAFCRLSAEFPGLTMQSAAFGTQKCSSIVRVVGVSALSNRRSPMLKTAFCTPGFCGLSTDRDTKRPLRRRNLHKATKQIPIC